jgi:glycosyltransferase involved in cell wall biosynthesis
VDLENEIGGVSNVVRQICIHAAKLGNSVTLVCGNREMRRVCSQPYSKIQRFGIYQVVLEQRSHPVLGPFQEVIKAIDINKPFDVAHVHTCFSSFTEMAMHYLRKNHIPFVFSPHGKLSPNMLSKQGVMKKVWWHLFGRRCVENATVYGMLSEEEKFYLQQLKIKDRKIISIPNGFESLSGSHDLSRPVSEPYVIYLGYLEPRKQPGLVVQAFAQTKIKDTHQLVIVGPDAFGHRAAVEKFTNELNIAHRVIFWGPAYGAEKWALLKNAECLCLPSLAEGQPVVISEAMGVGLPCIVSHEANCSFVWKNGAGLVVDSFEPEAWAAAIEKICEDVAFHRNLSIAAKQLGAELTWEKIVRRWCTVYSNILFSTANNYSN